MKNIILTLIITLSLNAFAQVGVNSTNPDPSAVLDVESTTSGFLPPRMTEIQMDDIFEPAEGLVIYCTDCDSRGLRVFDGSSWTGTSGSFGDIKTGIQTGDHDGWIKLDGRPLSGTDCNSGCVDNLTKNQRAVATSLNIVGNLPNANNAVLVQKDGGTLGEVTGSNTVKINRNNLPNIRLKTFSQSSAGLLDLSNTTNPVEMEATAIVGYNFNNDYTYAIMGTSAYPDRGSIESLNPNGQIDLNITPKSLSVNTFIYLGL